MSVRRTRNTPGLVRLQRYLQRGPGLDHKQSKICILQAVLLNTCIQAEVSISLTETVCHLHEVMKHRAHRGLSEMLLGS